MSARAPLVSIQVPAYNAARYLPGLCQSIQAQTYPHYEVLLGDDGSSDDTLTVLAPFLQDNRFRFVRWQPNRGLCRGMEIMCASMSGEYWCCTGADDLFYPEFLEKRVELRRAEDHLMPLVALRTAAQFSQRAALSWAQWGRTLYCRWLRQALALRCRGGLKPEWVQLAGHAYYGARGRRVSFWVELTRHFVGLVAADFTHRLAQRRQSFVVSGLAQIADPIFR